jgi:hypothetical protein
MGAFNWVTARQSCSLAQVFKTLEEVLDSDVKAAQGLGILGVEFKIITDATNKIVVGRSQNCGGLVTGNAVVFELTPTEIRVKDSRTEQHLFSARPNLNIAGECLLEIDGQPYQFWQVSRKALEDLFFGQV